MAPKRFPKTTPKLEPEFFEEPTQSEVDIEDFLIEWAPQTSIVEIYRRKEDGSMPHLKRVGIEILRADLYGFLRDKFGNGKFILQFKDANRRIVKNLTVDVDGAPAVVLNPGSANNGSPFHEQLILAMIAAQKPAPPIDMGTLLTGLGTMLAALKPAPAPATDPAAMLQAMAATFQQLKPPDDNVDKALSIISKAKDLAGESSGNGDSWSGLIKEGFSAAAQVFSGRQNPTRANLPPGAMPTGLTLTGVQQPAHELQPQPMREKSSDELLQEWLQTQIGFLKTKARAGKDPDFWAEYTLENSEEPGCAAILEALRRGATFQHLLTFDPEIGKDPVLANWFQQFYEALQSEPDETMDSTGTGRNAPDPGGHEKPSAS